MATVTEISTAVRDALVANETTTVTHRGERFEIVGMNYAALDGLFRAQIRRPGTRSRQDVTLIVEQIDEIARQRGLS